MGCCVVHVVVLCTLLRVFIKWVVVLGTLVCCARCCGCLLSGVLCSARSCVGHFVAGVYSVGCCVLHVVVLHNQNMFDKYHQLFLPTGRTWGQRTSWCCSRVLASPPPAKLARPPPPRQAREGGRLASIIHMLHAWNSSPFGPSAA